MDRLTTFGRGSDIPAATLNALQNLSFGLRKGSGSVAGAAARQGATVCTWASADAGVADETVAVVDATAGVDWRGRVLWGWLIRLESEAHRAHRTSAWQTNDPTRPSAVRVFGGRANTGTGGLRAGASLAVADGYPPSIENGSFAVVIDEGATVADRVWLYARATDGALCLYNASGGALHAELLVFGAAVPPDPSAPPPAVIPTLTEVQWLDPAVAADRPADPGGPALFRATDTGALSLWDGGAWRAVGDPPGRTTGDVDTTDATWTTIVTITPAPSSSLVLAGSVAAITSDGGDGGGWAFVARVHRGASGNPSVVTTTFTLASFDGTDWDVRVQASGGDVVVQVQGEALTEITWRAEVQTTEAAI